MIRIPASGDRIGVLVVNPGGPGASAVDTVASMGASLAGTDILRRFDLVGIDPRGVGHSTPELRCRTDAEFDAFRREPMVDYSPAGVAQIEGLYSQFAQDCADRMGTDFLANVGTASSAHDMDVVRAALGENQINYLGFSYGTELGAAYAERYGDRVRAMVLDGAVDPSVDPVADDHPPNGGVPNGLQRLRRRLRAVARLPARHRPGEVRRPLSPAGRPAGADAGRNLGSARPELSGRDDRHRQRALHPALLAVPHQRAAGPCSAAPTPGTCCCLADDYQHRDESGHYANLQDAFTAIRCVDSPYPTDPAVWADADRRIRADAPFMSYGDFTGFAPRDPCAMWPVPPTSTPHPATSPGPGKVVVVSTTHDPATPYQAGVDLARQMGAALITFEGTQHTVVFNGDQCVDTAVVNFLIDSVTPPDGLRCQT